MLIRENPPPLPDEIIVTYIDEHVNDDDEKHKGAGLGMKTRFGLGMKARFGDGRKLPPKIRSKSA